MRTSRKALAGFAERLGLVASGGTDYHGDLGPYAEAHAGLWFPDAAAERFHRSLGLGSEALR